MNPMKAIRAKCLDCSGGSIVEVRECGIETCVLHQFRMGKNPFRKKREMSPEQKSALADRLAAAREQKAAN